MALKLTAADAHAKTIVAGKIIEIASIREISVDAL
jgi:hypothetical protein